MIQRAKSVARDRPSTLRRVLKSGLLHKIRSRNFNLYSDRDLKDTLDSLKERSQHEASGKILPDVFAIVAEGINRRLGAWRIFGPLVNESRWERYRNIAAQISRSGNHKTQMNCYIDEDFPKREDLDNRLTALLANMSLDPDEQTIIKAIVYVAEKSKTKYRSSILLPAMFYQALARVDTGSALGFHVTDEQLLAGIMLYQGSVVELNSGEGKTIAAAFPAVLHAVLGNPVHIITSNDYLAARDRELLAPVYKSLDLTVDVVLGYLSDEERRDAYTKQIVYGTLREFGFDFLRDNIKNSREEQVQRVLGVAIVDEVDHALIDEANTPMIIGGEPTGTRRAFARVKNTVEELIALQDSLARSLEEMLPTVDRNPRELHVVLAKLLLAQPDNSALRHRFADNPKNYKRALALIDQDKFDYPHSALTTELLYAIDPQNRFVTLTERGQELLETRLGQFFNAESLEREIASVAQDTHMTLAERRKASARLARQLFRQYNLGNQVYQMLRADLLLKRDVDYLVTEDSIVLIDKCTGRPRPDSRYQQGLHEALEAKEGVTVHSETRVLARISVQGFMSQYRKTSGMTGTALSSRDEFQQTYGLSVEVIPPNQPPKRVDLGYKIYPTRQDKLSAVVDEVAFCRQVGRPVLVATLTIEQSEEISLLLTKRGVSHNLLNAVSSHDEARIVKEAGNLGAVTVATNVAGRGTDIILEPDLSSLISGRYRALVQQLLSQGCGPIVLNCYTREEADILQGELSSCGLFSITTEKSTGIERLLVTSRNPERRGGKSISLDFGLGLHIIGTEFNQSPRIDLQLKGRSGRQGEFGWSRFILSLEDQCFVYRTPGASYPSTGKELDLNGGAYLEGKDVDRHLESIREMVEQEGEVQRRIALDYGGVLDSQTLLYYHARRDVMESASFRDNCLRFAREKARYVVDQYLPEGVIADYGLRFDRLVEELQEDYKIDCSGLRGCDSDYLIESIGDMLVAQVKWGGVSIG